VIDQIERYLSKQPKMPFLLLLLFLTLLLFFAFRVPFRSGGASGKNPQGEGQGCPSFSTGQGCPVEKSRWWSEPRPQRGRGAKAGCAFFWLLFFAQAKKSNSLNSEALSESV